MKEKRDRGIVARLKSLEISDDGNRMDLVVRAPAELLAMVADAMVKSFDEGQGINYVSWILEHDERGPFELVLRRHEGKRPAERVTELEAEVRRLQREGAALWAVTKAARGIVAAADACDREAERHPAFRSSAPVVRAINAMETLRGALRAIGAAGEES